MKIHSTDIEPILKWSLELARKNKINVRLMDPLTPNKSYPVNTDGSLGDIHQRQLNGCFMLDELTNKKIKQNQIRSIIGKGWLYIDKSLPNLEYTRVNIHTEKISGFKKLFHTKKSLELPKLSDSRYSIIDNSIYTSPANKPSEMKTYGFTQPETNYIFLHELEPEVIIHELAHKWFSNVAAYSPDIISKIQKEVNSSDNIEITKEIRNNYPEINSTVDFMDEFTARYFEHKILKAIANIPSKENISKQIEDILKKGSLSEMIYHDLNYHSFSLYINQEMMKNVEIKYGIENSNDKIEAKDNKWKNYVNELNKIINQGNNLTKIYSSLISNGNLTVLKDLEPFFLLFNGDIELNKMLSRNLGNEYEQFIRLNHISILR